VREQMTADDVLSVLAVLRNADVDIRIGGGWGIDALVGEQTRRHRDLDLMHRKNQETAVVAALADAGFVEALASHLVLRHRHHPGATVPCLSPEQQVCFHKGYGPAAHDRHDMALLRQRIGITTHF
jgi:lincosamide nucleotidyltransferase A/C/D/E